MESPFTKQQNSYGFLAERFFESGRFAAAAHSERRMEIEMSNRLTHSGQGFGMDRFRVVEGIGDRAERDLRMSGYVTNRSSF